MKSKKRYNAPATGAKITPFHLNPRIRAIEIIKQIKHSGFIIRYGYEPGSNPNTIPANILIDRK